METSNRRAAVAALLAVNLALAACVGRPGGLPTAGPSAPVLRAPTQASSIVPAATSPTVAPSASASGAETECTGQDASADYCRRLGDWVRRQEHLSADTPLRVEQLPPPPCATTAAGKPVLCAYGGGPPRPIRATTSDGLTFDLDLPCIGIPDSAICYEQPPLMADRMQGYWDVPCSGEAPDGCATPLAPDPEAVARARPLVIESLEVRVAPVGHHELEIGHAVLPNGILSHASMALAKEDETQRGFVIDPMYVRLEVRPMDPKRPPFRNVYERGRIPGVEEVKVLVVFDVVEASADAVIHLTDIEVR